MKRQQIRKLLLLISLLLFPITMWYFSPAIIMMAFAQHILNGSFFVFLGMLLLSLFCGRIFCGYLCPVGCLQECIAGVNNKPARLEKRDYIKFVIWTIWIAVLAYLFFTGKGKVKVDFFFMTTHGISIAEIADYITYYGVILLLFLPALIHGRRAGCHYICWMAPFMMIGSKIGQKLHLPQLHVAADISSCISCKKCTNVCPMGLDVEKMLHEKGNTCNGECINCGSCIDNCPKKALSFKFKWK